MSFRIKSQFFFSGGFGATPGSAGQDKKVRLNGAITYLSTLSLIFLDGFMPNFALSTSPTS